jgi:plasmid stabilization system protein ParE
MKLIVRSHAEEDLDEAGSWYEDHRPGLKKDFLGAVEEVLLRIEENPKLYQTIHLDIRRAPLDRFPYGVYYALIQEEIHILAVVHDARHPSVWRRRR